LLKGWRWKFENFCEKREGDESLKVELGLKWGKFRAPSVFVVVGCEVAREVSKICQLSFKTGTAEIAPFA
jgi:hypothetical protein